jgi:hypothetical protein
MQAVGADDEIEAARWRALEGDSDAVPILMKPGGGIAEQDFRSGLRALEQQAGEVAAPDGHETPSGQLPEHARGEPRQAPARVIDNAQLPHVVAQAIEVAREPHSFGDVVADAPEVDHITAGSE